MVADLVYFSFSQLFKHGVHLGLQSTLLHSSMLKYLLPINYLNFTLFNLNFAYIGLRLVSNFIITMNSMRKPSLVINSVSFLDDFLVDFFSGLNQPVARGLWVSGRLTNFRFVRQSSVRRFYLHKIIIKAFSRIEAMGLSNSSIRNIMNRTFNPIRYKQSVFRHVMNLTRMPRFCFINDSTINAVAVNECFILNIPSICSVDSGSSNTNYVTYPIPGNSVSLASVLLYYSIYKYSIQRGIYKERYLFILKAIQTKLKLHAMLKQSSSSFLQNKNRMPFVKSKVRLDLISNSFVNALSTYKLSNTYDYFFTSDVSSFKKLTTKYLVICRSISQYNSYFSSYNGNNLTCSVFSFLNNKLYSYLLSSNLSSNTGDVFGLSLNFLKLGDLVVASVFRDIFSKIIDVKQNFVLKQPIAILTKLAATKFHKNLLNFINNLRDLKRTKASFFNTLYYTDYLVKETGLLFSTVDIFNNNFCKIYKKIFLLQKKITKVLLTFRFLLFNTSFGFKFLPNSTEVLLLWLMIFNRFNQIFIPKRFIQSSYLPKNNFSLISDFSKNLDGSYALFYDSLSINYRHIKPFILDFSWIKPTTASSDFTKPTTFLSQSIATESRRW